MVKSFTLNCHNSGYINNRVVMFWFYGMVFGVGQITYASHIWLGHTLVAMATKICYFQHKIGYNSAYAGDTPQMLAPTRGFRNRPI